MHTYSMYKNMFLKQCFFYDQVASEEICGFWGGPSKKQSADQFLGDDCFVAGPMKMAKCHETTTTTWGIPARCGQPTPRGRSSARVSGKI